MHVTIAVSGGVCQPTSTTEIPRVHWMYVTLNRAC